MLGARISEGSDMHSGKYSTSQNCQETHGSNSRITCLRATRRSSDSPLAKSVQ